MGYYPMQVPPSTTFSSSNPTYIKLNNNASAYFIGFDGNDTNSLVFRYTVAEGESVEALDIDWYGFFLSRHFFCTHAHACAHACVHRSAHAHTRTCTHALHAQMHAPARAHANTHMHAHMHAQMHAPTCAHTNAHTHAHTHVPESLATKNNFWSQDTRERWNRDGINSILIDAQWYSIGRRRDL